MKDVIVIGQGPSGISCAIYLKRFNLNPIVIAKDFGALETKATIENYYGIESIDGKELIQKGIDQAKKLGIEVINEEVISIENYGTFEVITNKNKYEGKAVYLAVGKAKAKLNKKGLKEFEGKGISYCATCDGFFFRKKRIGIVGSGDYMLKELEVLRNFSDDIIVFSSSDLDIKEKVVKDEIIEFYGNDKLEGVKTINDDYKLDAVFIALGSLDAFSIAKHLGLILDEKNNIVVNDYMSNIEGVFAGGDVIGGLLQVSKASSDGANAAFSINKYLKSRK
jgi:thioredoxin reductase (NADPH)